MANELHSRRHTVTGLLSDEEHTRLQAIRAARDLPIREVLMAGVRRCERHWAAELRRQRQLDEE